MGPRIKLFQTERQEPPKTLHMVLEDMQSAMLEIEASAAENPNIAPVNTPQEEALLEVVIAREEQELEAITEVVDSSLPAIGALEDTAYGIAPAIQSARPTDIALVRQVANTAADALGVPTEELLVGVDDSNIGQPLVLEGFKEKARAAARAVWVAIANIFDRMWTLFQANFSRIGGKLKKLHGVVRQLESGAVDATVRVSASMNALTATGTLDAASVLEQQKNSLAYNKFANIVLGSPEKLYSRIASKVTKPGKADEIEEAFKDTVTELIGAYADIAFGSSVFEASGDDYRTKFPINGDFVVLKNLAKANGLIKSDPLAAAAEFNNVSIETEGSNLKLPETVDYTAENFRSVATATGKIFSTLTPGMISHTQGLVRMAKRDVSVLGDKVTNHWTQLLDAEKPEVQNQLRPFVSAVGQLVNKHASLTSAIYARSMSSIAAELTAVTMLLEQGVKGKTDDKKEEK